LYSHKFSNPAVQSDLKPAPKTELEGVIRRVIDEAGGWIDFANFMDLALYDPKLGYYSSQNQQIGYSPLSGSDFVTAPVLTKAFAKALAVSVREALDKTQTQEIWEFGPGTGVLASQLLESLGDRISKYNLVEVSGGLRARQSAVLSAYADKVNWVSELPEVMNGVVIGNEVLDAIPVNIIKRIDGIWYEQGVCLSEGLGGTQVEGNKTAVLGWAGRLTDLRPPSQEGLTGDYLTEVHPRAEAFVQTLVNRLEVGAMFFLDYGFPEREYYHPQRHMGTLMCHLRHVADDNPLVFVGHKDITTHVNFTGIALAAQECGANVLGYTSQAHFLLNNGFLDFLEDADLSERARALKLIHEHEMGELFKVLIIGLGSVWDPIGCLRGDRTHTL